MLLQRSGFNLDEATVSKIVQNADTDHNGVIEYHEMVPMLLKLLGFKDETTAVALQLSKYSRATLMEYFRRLFLICDRDGSGSLDRQEVEDMLKKSGFSFDS